MSSPQPTPPAAEIVKASGSNLAFALAVLPKEKREDMEVFYAFCRVVDDIADDGTQGVEARREGLSHWRDLIQERRAPESDAGLEAELMDLCRRYTLERGLLEEIIAGMEMDLEERRYDTFEDLRAYCYRAASAVGLVSIEIFGYQSPQTRNYAEQLGYAFQLTNILRDVAQDWQLEKRIYLPREDLERFGYSAADLAGGVYNEAFKTLMGFQSERAEACYQEAVKLLPEEDRDAMRAAELMRKIYHKLLGKMKADGFRVFDKRYRLSKLEMAGFLVAAGLSSRFHS